MSLAEATPSALARHLYMLRHVRRPSRSDTVLTLHHEFELRNDDVYDVDNNNNNLRRCQFHRKKCCTAYIKRSKCKKNLLIEIVISQAYQRTEGGKFTNSKGFYTRLLSFTTLAFFFTRHDWRGERTSAWLSKVAC